VQEAEAHARADQEARLREEQMRIDAQMKMAEKKAKPKWPLAVVPVLVLMIGFAGYIAWDNDRKADEQAARDQSDKDRLEQEKKEQAAALASITEKLEKLETQQVEYEKERAALDAQLEAAQDMSEKARLQREKKALEAKIAENQAAQSSTRRKKRTSNRSKPSDEPSDDTPAPVTKERKDRINLGEGDDPLSGL
jgi:hypothetical protein